MTYRQIKTRSPFYVQVKRYNLNKQRENDLQTD